MYEFHNSWGNYLDIKLSYFNSRLTSVLNIHVLHVSNVSAEDSDRNTDYVPWIEGLYYFYIYDGKIVIAVLMQVDK